MEERIERMEELATKQFNAANSMFESHPARNRSIYDEPMHDIHQMIREADRLLNRTMCMGEAEFNRVYYAFMLSVQIVTELEKLV